MDFLLGHTRVKLTNAKINGAVESAALIAAPTRPRIPKCVKAYKAPAEIPPALEAVFEEGWRTVAIGLPKNADCIEVAKHIEAHCLEHGRQFIYIGLYGSKKQLAQLWEEFGEKRADITALLVDSAPKEYVVARRETIAQNAEDFTGTPIRVENVELVIVRKANEKLLQSAIKEYLAVMKTKSYREFAALYDRVPSSKAVAAFECKTIDGEDIRLVLFDFDITPATIGATITLPTAFLAVTEFLDVKPSAALFKGNCKASVFAKLT